MASPRRAPASSRHLLVSLALALGLLAGALATVVATHPAGAACASPTKTVGGVFRGSDQRRLSGLVGVVLYNAQGQTIDKNGCPSGGGYAAHTPVNATPNGCCAVLPLDGAAPNDGRYADRWEIGGMPSNAVTMWVEAYPKSSEDASATPYSHYGGAMRRLVPANTSADIYLPKTCATGGSTATIVGKVTKGGSPARVKEVTAFSRAAEGTGATLGFVAKAQAGASDGSYDLPALANDQRYALRIDLLDGTGYWFEHDYGQGVAVGSCTTTTVDFATGADGKLTITRIVQPAPDGSNGPTAPSPKKTTTHSITGSFSPVVGDFRAIGRDDILWFSPGGGDAFWRSNGSGGFVNQNISVSGSFTPIVGDFDGDDHDDIYWFSPTGGDAWYRGTDTGFTATYPNANGDFAPLVGDFDGNGSDDIYWFSTYGGDAVYWGHPGGFTATYPNANGSFTALVGDFNANGADDIYWFSPAGGDAVYWGNAGGFTATYPNANGDFAPLVGDFDGDNLDDIYWFSPTGGDALYWGGPGGFTASYPNANGPFWPVRVDLDNTGGDDIVWYAPGTAGDAYWKSSGNRGAPFTGGSLTINGSYLPVTGRLDSGVADDVLWYDPTDNPDALWHD